MVSVPTDGFAVAALEGVDELELQPTTVGPTRRLITRTRNQGASSGRRGLGDATRLERNIELSSDPARESRRTGRCV
jgi:hypothetical protein